MVERGDLDIQLLRGVAKGDQKALAQLYDHYASTLLAIGIRMLKDRREAEDVLHDVVVEVWKRAGDYDPRRGRVKTWLFLRMRSRCLDRLKSPRLARRAEMNDAAPPVESRAEGAGERAVERGSVRSALSQLSATHRDVLILGYFEGLSSTEIAKRLGIPVGTVKSRTRGAMERLRAVLGARQEQIA